MFEKSVKHVVLGDTLYALQNESTYPDVEPSYSLHKFNLNSSAPEKEKVYDLDKSIQLVRYVSQEFFFENNTTFFIKKQKVEKSVCRRLLF